MKRGRAFILPVLLVLIPIVVLTVFTLVQMSIVENGFALQQERQKKLFYLAEAGLNIGYYAFAAGNFTQVTNAADGTTPVSGANLLQINDIPQITYDGTSGAYRYQWNPGDPPDQSFTGDGVPESFKFQAFYPNGSDPTQWRMVCQASLGNRTETHTTQGFAITASQYALYANGDLADFSRYASTSVTGNVQVNGNAYFCPMLAGTVLSLHSNLVQLGGAAYRFEDIWGNPDRGGDVYLSRGGQNGSATVMEGASQGLNGQGQEYDSYNPAWTHTDNTGAVQKYGGTIVDQNLGGQSQQPPSPAFAAGAYYDQLAGLHVTSASGAPWLSTENLQNASTGLPASVQRIDLQLLALSSDWPANGIIYANTPVALIHGEQLKGPLTVVSNSTIYVHGSYNRNFTNLVAQLLYLLLGVSARQPAAIMTSDRIFFLSDAWNDAASFGAGPLVGAVYPLFLGDLNALLSQIWEVNAELVDGAPPIDLIGWVPSWQGVVNPLYHPTGDPHTNMFLESNLGTIDFAQLGAIVHVQNATMAAFDNSNAGPGITPWMVQSGPAEPQRAYQWDAGLSPPGALKVGAQTLWQHTSP